MTKRERIRARCSVEQGTRMNLGGGKKEGTKLISDGRHRILKIGTESRGNHNLCSGLELHHTIMSKLWNLVGQTKRKEKKEYIYRHRKPCNTPDFLDIGRGFPNPTVLI